MHLRHEISYDATAAEVFAMLADPEFRRTSAVSTMDATSVEVDVQPAHAEGMTVRVDQTQPTTGVPAFARRFAGATTRSVQHEDWTDARHATFTIETPGKPTRVSGTRTLVESAGVTTETMDVDIAVTVPLIGGRLEQLMADLFAQGRDKEQAAGAAWLGGER